MRKAEIYRNGELAGVLTEEDRSSYLFSYTSSYFSDSSKPAVSLTLPKIQQEFHSDYLFPCFFNMLSEGANKALQCSRLKIDEDDSFGLLLATAHTDTIGSITVKEIE
jgi:HipA-like protein